MSQRWVFLLGKSFSSRRSISPSSEILEEDARFAGGEEEKDASPAAAGEEEEERWAGMLPDLMVNIIRRVEASEERWPRRKSLVSCACVCRRWRQIAIALVGPPRETGKITFPSSLKQPGTRDLPIQCFIKRNKKNSTFYLYLSLTQTFMDKGKFLLAARKYKYGAYTEYIISLDADDLTQGSNAYVGKLRSDFLGMRFTIYDGNPLFNGARASSIKASRRFFSKQISPQVPADNLEIGQVSYKLNLLKTRGPRRMQCILQCHLMRGTSDEESQLESHSMGSLVLKNKAPRWHDHLQCWCLNFHGRVTVASVKNFQLVAMMDPSQPDGVGDEETVLLQFGKVGDDLFTMDYREPLSAFQAFALCLTSFGTKFACE